MLTLRTLCERRDLALTVLVPGPEGALDAEVSWTHNTELPDPSPYLRRGELVMTNGLWHIAGHPAESFVLEVRDAGASGIVFGLRREMRATPADVIDACRKAGMPLLELSVDVPFTALSQAAAQTLAEQRQSTLMASVRRGNALADAISSGTGAGGVLRVLRRDHDLRLAVVDRMGHLLGSAGADLTDDDLVVVARAVARRPPPLEVTLSDDSAALFPVGVFGEADAALVCLRPAAALDEAERGALEQAAHFLSMETARLHAVQATEMRFAGELIDMIFAGAGASREFAARLKTFGIEAGDPLAVCALALADEEAAVSPVPANAVMAFFVSEGVPAVVAPGGRDTVALFPWRLTEGELEASMTRLLGLLDGQLPERRVVLGYGGPAGDSTKLKVPLMEAREACQLLARGSSAARMARFAELPSHSALLGRLDGPVVQRFADALLAPLRDHDAQRGAQLELTLRTFLAHEGQFAVTADALYIHVNTLRKRLTRIGELTGRDPMKFEGRVDLFLALEADALVRS
jgi:sugar diacid utilization regulator